MPVRLRRTLAQLMGQQFWLFGCDIRRPEGNVLAELGFVKCRSPLPGEKSPSRYHLTLPAGETLVLWGFGMLWANSRGEAVFLSRHRFAPLVRHGGERVPDAWTADEIPNLQLPLAAECPQCGALVLGALDWMIGYERHVASCRGYAYRDETIRAWRKPVGTGADLPGCWRESRDALATHLHHST